MTTLRSPSLTAVVLVLEDTAELAATHARYAKALEPAAERVDFVYVVDGQLPKALSALRELRRKALPVEVLCFPTRMGEAAALSVGLQAATVPSQTLGRRLKERMVRIVSRSTNTL